MFELFKLVGRVMVDNSGANQALGDTDKKAQNMTSNLGGYLDKLKGWATAAAAALAGSAIVKGVKEVWDISTQVADIGDNIDKASQKFMLSRQAYQEWSFVAQRSGFDINTLGDAVFELSKKIGEGKEESLAVLEELGISAADAMTATPEELFDMVVEGLQGVDDVTRRAYLADTLFGGAAKELNPLLNMSAKETKNLKEEVNKLGGVMSDQLVDQSAKFKDSQTNLQTAWDGVKNHLAENTLPGMTQIMDGLTQMLTGDFAGGLETAADGVSDYLTGLLETFNTYTESIWAAISSKIQDSQYALGSLFGMDKETVDAGVDAYYNDEFQLPSGEWVTQSELDDRFRHANGIQFVPRNDYPATLHYGERVLTRQEAEEYNSGRSSGGNTTIHIHTVAQSPAQTAAAITAALARARWAM